MQISILDLEINNIKSVYNATKLFGNVNIVKNYKELKKSDIIILPGNGSFESGIKALRTKYLIDVINNYFHQNKKIIGICLGLQLLMTSSEEGGLCDGLNLIKGKVIKINNKILKTPLLGWYEVDFKDNFFDKRDFFFNNNYMVDPNDKDCIVGYMEEVPACLQKNCFTGFQFHPEKSSEYGLKILEKIIFE